MFELPLVFKTRSFLRTAAVTLIAVTVPLLSFPSNVEGKIVKKKKNDWKSKFHNNLVLSNVYYVSGKMVYCSVSAVFCQLFYKKTIKKGTILESAITKWWESLMSSCLLWVRWRWASSGPVWTCFPCCTAILDLCLICFLLVLTFTHEDKSTVLRRVC